MAGGGRNERGNTEDRRRRKVWLLDTFGDGTTVACHLCGLLMTLANLTVDRWPTPGRHGGRYVRGNMRPLCLPCNSSEGARSAHIERQAAKAGAS